MSKLKVKAGSDRIHDRFQTALANLVPKNRDSGTFTYARSIEDSPTAIRYVVTTGIRAFDDRVGGMPFGKATELVGLPQSGKTTMAVRTVVRAQQGYLYERIQKEDGSLQLKQLKPGSYMVHCAYYDQEGSMSDRDKRTVDGIMMDAEIFQCDTVELIWVTMDKMMTILDEEQEETGIQQFLVVIIDTVGSLSTKSEFVMAWGKTDYPRVPQELKTGMKVMIGRMQRENVMLIGCNHVARSMDVRGRMAFRGWHYTSPGGMAFSYYTFHRVFFEMLKMKYSLASKGNPDGYVVYFQTLKNRLMPVLREGRLALLFTAKDQKQKVIREGGFHDQLSLLEALFFGKAAKVSKATGAISFRFEAFGIATTTFGAKDTVKTLDEQEDEQPEERPRLKRDPKIANRAAWAAFYVEHQADCEALYEEVTRRALASSESVGTAIDDEDAEDDEDESD